MAADYRVFETAWGWCAAARGELGVCAFVLPRESQQAAEEELRSRVPGAVSVPGGMSGLARQVTRYFEGKRVDFEADLDFTAGTPFQRRVWEAVCAVPYGQVRTYQGLAMAIGRPQATRAVGTAVGRNPIPLLVPCHRVVRGDGGLGGFRAHGGVKLKRAMLEMEGVRIFGTGRATRVLA